MPSRGRCFNPEVRNCRRMPHNECAAVSPIAELEAEPHPSAGRNGGIDHPAARRPVTHCIGTAARTQVADDTGL